MREDKQNHSYIFRNKNRHIDLFVIRMSSLCKNELHAHIIIRIFYDNYDDEDEDERYSDKQTC